MTAEELVIGHYEKTLTSDQESQLSSMMDSSPDVRVLYEQHGNVHNLLVEEAATVRTSSKLDKVVVGAALGTLVEIAGHGIGLSILGKVASIVGVIAVGGLGYVLYDTYIDNDAPTNKTPAPAVVNQAPNATPTPALPEVTTPTPSASDAPATTSRSSGDDAPRVDAGGSRSASTASGNRTDANASTSSANRNRGIILNNRDPDATIDTSHPRIRGSDPK